MSKVAWVVQDGDGAVVVLAHSERGAVERYLVEFMGVLTEDLHAQMAGWPENEEVMSFGVEAVPAQRVIKRLGQEGPVRLSQVLGVGYDCECPVCGAPVASSKETIAAARAYEALEDAAEALQELVRLKDLKGVAQAALSLEAHDAAWAAARAAVRRMGVEEYVRGLEATR